MLYKLNQTIFRKTEKPCFLRAERAWSYIRAAHFLCDERF